VTKGKKRARDGSIGLDAALSIDAERKVGARACQSRTTSLCMGGLGGGGGVKFEVALPNIVDRSREKGWQKKKKNSHDDDLHGGSEDARLLGFPKSGKSDVKWGRQKKSPLSSVFSGHGEKAKRAGRLP